MNKFKKYLIFLYSCFYRKFCKKQILLLPPTVLNGSFGDEIMTVAFLEQNKDKDITLYLREIIDRPDLFKNYQKVKQLEWGNPFDKFSEIYLLGADIIAANHDIYERKFKFDVLAKGNKLKMKTGILGFSWIEEELDTVSTNGFNTIKNKTNFYLRDIDSYQRAKQLLPEERISLVADTAFLCPYDKNRNKEYLQWISKQKQENRIIIAVCPNAIQAQNTGLEKYMDDFNEILHYMDKKYNVAFALFYHDVRRYWDDLSDRDLSRRLFEKRNNKSNVFFTETIQNGVDLKSYLEFVDFTFTGRMHFGISGYSLKKPMFGITYVGKFSGLQKLFGLDAENTLINDYKNPIAEIHKIDYFWDNLIEINQRIAENYEMVLALAKKNFLNI